MEEEGKSEFTAACEKMVDPRVVKREQLTELSDAYRAVSLILLESLICPFGSVGL